MPTVINGIGTWYYGRRRIHRVKNTCEFCNRIGELESYDTTLYFTVLFIPVVPLGQKRILYSCPYCRKHRVTSLKQWESAKVQAIAQLMDKLGKAPDDRETIREAIALAHSYQDEVLFDKLADGLASHWLEDAAIQAQLGAAYSYFARRDEAEAAFRASLAAEDNPEIRRQLGLTLMRQGRPEDALPFLRHILDEKIRDRAGLIYLLVESYQAKGLHEAALELMDRRDAAFPDLVDDKDIKKQRKLSERYQASGKKVAAPHLDESGKTGYSEGNWTARLPRLIAPLVILALLLLYLGAAIWTGQARQVYLVNGWDQPYTVAINGQQESLQPGTPKAIRVAEGDISIEFPDGKIALESVHCHIETPFFSRPFARETFVINPDQVAIIVWQEAVDSAQPLPPSGPPTYYTGKVLHSFQAIDYEFTNFPPSIKIEHGVQTKKKRVSLLPNLTPEQRLEVAAEVLDQKQQAQFGKDLLKLNPDDSGCLSWLIGRLSDQEGLEFLNTRLAARPVLVEWHRAYQTLMEKTHPEEDLLPRYRQLVAENKGNADVLYLLGRINQQDLDESELLLKRAAEAVPPSIYAMNALGYSALVQGQFASALLWTQKAHAAAPQNSTMGIGYERALMAAGKFEPLLEQLRISQDLPGMKLKSLLLRLVVYGRRGDKKNTQATIQEVLQLMGPSANDQQRRMVQNALESTVCCCNGDVAGYLKIASQASAAPNLYTALLQGKLLIAASLAANDKDVNDPNAHALLYLAALKAGDKKMGDEQWQALLKELAKAGGHEQLLGDMLAGRKPAKVEMIRRLHIEPEQKRVLLVVASERLPESAKELVQLARALDFSPDPTSLCLRKILGKTPEHPPTTRRSP